MHNKGRLDHRLCNYREDLLRRSHTILISLDLHEIEPIRSDHTLIRLFNSYSRFLNHFKRPTQAEITSTTQSRHNAGIAGLVLRFLGKQVVLGVNNLEPLSPEVPCRYELSKSEAVFTPRSIPR